MTTGSGIPLPGYASMAWALTSQILASDKASISRFGNGSFICACMYPICGVLHFTCLCVLFYLLQVDRVLGSQSGNLARVMPYSSANGMASL